MLEKYLLIFHPDNYIQHYIATPNAIYEHRFLLRGVRFTNTSFRYLVQAVIDAVQDISRTRTLQLLIVLKCVLYRRDVDLDKDITDMLFWLFQRYIFSTGTDMDREIQRHANNLIRNQLLDAAQISWLIENFRRSEHILNRLIRYPGINEQVTDWAKGVYEANEFPNRTAELISIFMTDTLPVLCRSEDVGTLLWAIYYSKNTKQTKRKLILSTVNRENIENCINIVFSLAGRMDDYSIVEELLQKYCLRTSSS